MKFTGLTDKSITDNNIHDSKYSMQFLELLTSKQVNKIIHQIDALSSHWEQRNMDLPFFTLGAASYLDSSRVSNKRYYNKLERLNPILWANFEWLYDLVLGGLKQITGKACQLADGQALPGFHIFLAHQQFLEPVASMHIDLQHQTLLWPEGQQIDLKQNTLSFTLALALPESGAGLNTWPESHKDLMAMPFWSTLLGSAEIQSKCRYIEYQPGQMVIHSGQLLHQIAPLREYNPLDRRMTLQGHAVLCDKNTYLIYW